MIYFDNSATTRVKPPEVIAAVKNTLKYISANPGRSGHYAALAAGRLVLRARKAAAEFFNCPDLDRVIFTSGCTAALNAAVLGTVKKGGHIVISELEHNSVIRPVYELERAGLVTVSVAEIDGDGRVSLKKIKEKINKNTYLAAVTHVSNVTGAVNPIGEIGAFCREKGLLFLSDLAQSAGYRPVDFTEFNLDLAAAAPHKGLHGPQGVGLLLFNNRINVKPAAFGGTGTAGHSLYQPEDYPEGLESGTLPLPAVAGLYAALKHNKAHGAESAKQIELLSGQIFEGLSKIKNIKIYTNGAEKSGIIAFNIEGAEAARAADILNSEYGIAVRGGLHCAPLIHRRLGTINGGALRASVSGDNTPQEAETFLKAVYEIAK